MAPFPFTPEEYHAAAMACRIAAHQAEADAKNQQNPSIVDGFLATATGYRQLAAKFELASQQAR